MFVNVKSEYTVSNRRVANGCFCIAQRQQRLGSGSLSGWIDLDPVVAHMGFDLFASDIGNDEVGVLQRHVAIDAIFADLWTEFCEFATVFVFVTLQTFFGVGSGLAFGGVDVMAGGASHL